MPLPKPKQIKHKKTYSDYPEQASTNARRALKFKEENDNANDCGTEVGWTRARQLADRDSISRDTIARMASFKRHQQHKNVPYEEGCGGLMWDAWGGDAGIDWAIEKLKEIDNKFYNDSNMNKKANQQDLAVDQAVSWTEGNETMRGIIRDIVTGEFNIPGTEEVLEGDEEDPVFVIEQVEFNEETQVYEPNSVVEGHKAEELSKTDIEVAKTLAHEFELYQKGAAKAPTYELQTSMKVADGGKKVVLTMEEVDRDGETVLVDGIQHQGTVPMIDSHAVNDSITNNGLGAVRNLRVETIDGKKALVGDPEFAPTTAGKEAEILYLGAEGGQPFFTNVSMGFAVTDFERETKTIKQSELFELSLVTVGANRGARFINKQNTKNEAEQLNRKLARFEQINPAFKEFTNLFLSDHFCKLVGYQKDGDLLIDINKLYNELTQKLEQQEQEAPEAAQEAPDEQTKQPVASQQQLEKAIIDALESKIQNYILSK